MTQGVSDAIGRRIQSLGMLCVLGTLGSFCFSGPLSLAFRFLLSPEDFASAALFDTADGWTDCLTGRSPESLSLDGLDDEYRLLLRGLQVRPTLVRPARGSAGPKVERIADCGAAAATRRTEEGSMVPFFQPGTGVLRVSRGKEDLREGVGRVGFRRERKGSQCGRGRVARLFSPALVTGRSWQRDRLVLVAAKP